MITIEYEETRVRSGFGRKHIEPVYLMKHEKNGRVNRYRVVCEIEGIQSHDPHLSVSSAEWIGDTETESNDETLTESGATELFEENT